MVESTQANWVIFNHFYVQLVHIRMKCHIQEHGTECVSTIVRYKIKLSENTQQCEMSTRQ